MAAYLCSSDDVRLRFYRPSAKKRRPVRDAGGDGEGGGVGDDVGALAAEGEGWFREPKLQAKNRSDVWFVESRGAKGDKSLGDTYIKTYQHPHAAQCCLKRLYDLHPLFYAVTLLQHGSSGYVHIEEMQFSIPLLDLPLVIDPDQCVLDLLAIFRRLMDADIDRQVIFFGGRLEACDERTGTRGLCKRNGFGG